MNVATAFFDKSKINEQYLISEVQPKSIAAWFACICAVVLITALKPVRHLTGLYPLLTATILLPHIIGAFSYALCSWIFAFKKKYSLPWVMVLVHVNFIVFAMLVMAAGPKPWTPLWAAYLFYIAVVLNASGFQPFFCVVITAGGMLPWLFFALTGSSLARAFFPVCSVFTVMGLVQYCFVGQVVTRSRKMLLLEERLTHERRTTDEIQRIWRELHDGVGALLTQAILRGRIAALEIDNRNQAPDITRIKELFTGVMENLNAAMVELKEAVYLSKENQEWTLVDLGNDLREMFSEAFDSKGVALNLTIVDNCRPPDPLLPRVSHVLRRIAQEALTNVLRHSNATVVEIAFRRNEAGLSLRVQDNGAIKGAIGLGKGSGIESMQRRAQDIGGRFNIAQNPDGGVVVMVETPLATT